MRVTLTWGTRRWPNPRALDVALAVLLLMGAGYGADLLRDLPDRTVIARMGEVDALLSIEDQRFYRGGAVIRRRRRRRDPVGSGSAHGRLGALALHLDLPAQDG
ncbi:MAG: hypothetical protein HY047_07610, partial [Acidobacteria bacterium]|nr:hypothetical protein [Acidobacteriota bacterium]